MAGGTEVKSIVGGVVLKIDVLFIRAGREVWESQRILQRLHDQPCIASVRTEGEKD